MHVNSKHWTKSEIIVMCRMWNFEFFFVRDAVYPYFMHLHACYFNACLYVGLIWVYRHIIAMLAMIKNLKRKNWSIAYGYGTSTSCMHVVWVSHKAHETPHDPWRNCRYRAGVRNMKLIYIAVFHAPVWQKCVTVLYDTHRERRSGLQTVCVFICQPVRRCTSGVCKMTFAFYIHVTLTC